VPGAEQEGEAMESILYSTNATSSTSEAAGYVTGVLAGVGAVGAIIAFVLGILFIVAYFVTIATLANIAADKGGRIGKGKAWFIGLFMTPAVLALVVAADFKRHDNNVFDH
jgi:hypothetical protein